MAMPSVKSEIYDWLQCIVVALVISILLFVFVGRVTGIIGPSMEKTLIDGDKVIISNMFYQPKRGDIVIITKKSFDKDPIVKRIIATENQTVDIDFKTGEVRVDGVLQNEPYIAAATHKQYDVTFPVTVPKGSVFVMGDNRNVSYDSRASVIGMIDTRCILGKVYARITPINKIGIIK
jgi:signal peptidase I, bacterial type